MAEVGGWVWDQNVRPFLAQLARCVGCAFDNSDWQAVELGLADADRDRWYTYPLIGEPALEVSLAVNPGAAPVDIRVRGGMDAVLLARVETLVDVFCSVRVADPESP